MYVHIFGYLVNKLEIWWVYLSPIEKNKEYYLKKNSVDNKLMAVDYNPIIHYLCHKNIC